MQIREQIAHLLIRKTPGKARHIPFAAKNGPNNLGIRSRSTARKLVMMKDPAKIRRCWLESQVILFMAVSAAPVVELLPLSLLRSKAALRMAAGKKQDKSGKSKKPDSHPVESAKVLSPSSAMTAMNENLTPIAHAAQNRCFGCGTANPVGLHLQFYSTENGGVICDIAVPDTYEGPPGYVHGGIIATLLDETMSKAVRLSGAVAMTARMEVDYKRPVPSSAADAPKPVRLEGRVVRSEGRKHWLEARIVNADGIELAIGKGLFISISQPNRERLTS